MSAIADFLKKRPGRKPSAPSHEAETVEIGLPILQGSQSAAPPVELSDTGNAWRFRCDHLEVLRHVHVWASWLVWDGRRWMHDRDRRVEMLAKQSVAEMFRSANRDWQQAKDGGDKAEIAKAELRLAWAKKSHSSKAIAALIGLARSEAGLAMLPEAFDTDPWLLNVANGTLDLRSARLRPHDRGDCLTKLCPTRFDPDAKCPAWIRFLGLVFQDDEELIGFIRRFFGYCLTGVTTEHALLIPWGVGANGKSTLLETVMDVLGTDFCMKAPPSMLMSKVHESHPTERADLQGKRLVCAVETEDGKRLAESLVKELTGGDTIRARRMRENFFEFAPTHKLVLCSNHKPQVRGTDNGIWRRLRLVPFMAKFWNPDEPSRPGEIRDERFRADKSMREKLLAEREGILAWMVRGCIDWQRDGLGMPRCVAAATAEYRDEENLIERFVQERCERHREAEAKASELYGAFKTWCRQSGVSEDDTPSQRSLGLSLTSAGFERFTSNGTRYRGLQLARSEGYGDILP